VILGVSVAIIVGTVDPAKSVAYALRYIRREDLPSSLPLNRRQQARSKAMNKEDNVDTRDIIDLGTASVLTKGAGVGNDDTLNPQIQRSMGLTED
jgi:hypothetical protein